jgi:transposase
MSLPEPINKLRAMCESYSDVILRLASEAMPPRLVANEDAILIIHRNQSVQARCSDPRAGCFWLESRWDSRIGQILIQPVGWAEASRMPKPYSQDLRDRVIDAVERSEMSRRAAARRYEISDSVAIKWLERVERDGSREPVRHGGHRASKLMPHRDFLEAARSEKPDITFQTLCDRLLSERGVQIDTSMMSRFFRRIGVTVKKRPSSRASRIAQT